MNCWKALNCREDAVLIDMRMLVGNMSDNKTQMNEISKTQINAISKNRDLSYTFIPNVARPKREQAINNEK